MAKFNNGSIVHHYILAVFIFSMQKHCLHISKSMFFLKIFILTLGRAIDTFVAHQNNISNSDKIVSNCLIYSRHALIEKERHRAWFFARQVFGAYFTLI